MLLYAALIGLVAAGLAFADPETLIYRDRFGEPPATAALLDDFRRLPAIPPPAWQELQAEWSFALGDPKEGLNTSLSRLPEKRVNVPLPQRTLHPDTPYWYVADVNLRGPSVLSIQADDGAQLYVNGERVPIRGDYFLLPPNVRKAHLVVRVLNKAVYGGLEAVRVTSQQDFDRWQAASENRARLAALVRKVRLLLVPKPEEVEAARKAVQEGRLAAIGAAEKRLSAYPLTLVGPYLQDAASDRMTIAWETDAPCEAALEWGEGYALSHKVMARSEGSLHIAELTGLRPGAAYAYRTHSGPVLSPPHRFRTLPADGPVEFTAWGDSQNSWNVFRQNVHAMRRRPLAFTVGVGDVVEEGNRLEPWRSLFETLGPLAAEVPLMLVGGNHEYDGCFEDLRSAPFARYARSSPSPHYYAWTAGNARFVALDPNIHFPTGIPADSEERRWFLREIESPAWKRATWHFIFIHQPPYSQGWADYQGDLPIRAMLEPLLESHGIDFIVSGHTHDYERWTHAYGRQKVHFLIVGGAGGGLEDGPLEKEPVMDIVLRRHHFGRFLIEGSRVIFEAVATDTRVLDRLEVTK